MKQLNNNIDAFFKSEVEKTSLAFDKEKAWERLEKKRGRTNLWLTPLSIAASLILGCMIMIPNKKPHNNAAPTMSEYEKRQKLIEYEEVISGTYVRTFICFDCSGSILKSEIKQVPENKWILNVN